MNYEESVRALLSLGKELGAPRQPARIPSTSLAAPSTTAMPVQKFGIENISILAEDLGQPHRAMPCAHIAGTNGKGSTAAMLESILRAAGLRTGLYTSPHLELVNERIRIDGENISDQDFARGLDSRARLHRIAHGFRQALSTSNFLRMRHGHGFSSFCSTPR